MSSEPPSGTVVIGLGNPRGWSPDIARKLWSEKVHVSLRGDRLRISPHVYNTEDEIDRCVEILAAYSGAADEERNAQRISDQQEKLDALLKQRAALMGKT